MSIKAVQYLELLMFENYFEIFDVKVPEIENSLFAFDFEKGHASSFIQNSTLISCYDPSLQ